MRKNIAAFFCGLLFAAGLGVSGMTLPTRVVGFLDFFGGWDYSLMFVMGGAIAVYLPVWYAMKCRKSVLAGSLPCSARKDTDARLFIGASIFGIGWGLAGVCPGPGIVLLGRPSVETAAFVAAMLAGMLVHRALPQKRVTAASA
jgi:uncharacterized membrane protein YedE/YeeE